MKIRFKDKKIYSEIRPPLMGGVEWKIAEVCNYHCSYCLGKEKRQNDFQNKRAVKKISPFIFLDKFGKNLPGIWNFYFSGIGEPFLIPNFFNIARKLVRMGHRMEIVTNFSASAEKILKFCEIVNKGLRHFNASLHLEHADFGDFLKKAILVRRLIGNRFSVLSVARKGQVSKLKKIGQIFQDHKIPFRMQLERDYSKSSQDSFIKYTKKESGIIKDFNGDFYDKRFLKLKGKLCWAGSKYFVINERGDAWRCHQAVNQEYLGNLLEGTFKLNKVPDVCRYEYCACINPINLGMVVI